MSSTHGIVIIGGGGHGRVVAEAAVALGMRLTGFADDDVEADLGGLAPRLGSLGAVEHEMLFRHHPVILGLGEIRLRKRVIPLLHEPIATVVHPAAYVSPSAEIGPGVFVGPGAVVHAGAKIGAHATVNSGAIVEHDCEVGANSHVAPGAVLGGGVVVGGETLVGLGSRALPGVRIGSGCVVGAGSVVVSGVEDGALVVGAPARPMG